MPVHCAARLQRYLLILASYNYTLTFHSTKHHTIDADAMSRVPTVDILDPMSENVYCNFFNTTSNITANDIRKQTCRDPVFSKVFQYTQSGLPESSNPSFRHYLIDKKEKR